MVTPLCGNRERKVQSEKTSTLLHTLEQGLPASLAQESTCREWLYLGSFKDRGISTSRRRSVWKPL